MVKLILMMCLFFSGLSTAISKVMTIAFDNVGSKRVDIYLSDFKANVTSELGKKIIEFTQSNDTSKEQPISVEASTLQTYSMIINTENVCLANGTIFNLKDTDGNLLGSIKISSKGEIFLSDHGADTVVAGLFKNNIGMYQLVIATPENLEKFQAKKSKLLARVSGMPQQWFQCR